MSRWRLPSALIRSPLLEALSLLCTKRLGIMLYEPNVILNVDHDHPCDTDTPDIHFHLHLIERWEIRSVRPLGVPTEQLCR
jgi:hypothetical protein